MKNEAEREKIKLILNQYKPRFDETRVCNSVMDQNTTKKQQQLDYKLLEA